MRDVRISEEGNVGDAVIADEEIGFYQMVFHDLQRGQPPSRFDARSADFSGESGLCWSQKRDVAM